MCQHFVPLYAHQPICSKDYPLRVRTFYSVTAFVFLYWGVTAGTSLAQRLLPFLAQFLVMRVLPITDFACVVFITRLAFVPFALVLNAL